MNDTTLALISTISAAISAAGGLLATFAAFRSAGLAKTALEEAAALEKRRACDAILERAQRVMTEQARVSALVKKLQDESRDYAGFTGSTQGSWLDQKLQDLEKIREHLKGVEESTAESATSYKHLLSLSEDDLAALSSKLFNNLAGLRVTKEDLRDQLYKVREQNQLYRSKTLSSIPRAGGLGT
jgi:hypothetical protein